MYNNLWLCRDLHTWVMLTCSSFLFRLIDSSPLSAHTLASTRKDDLRKLINPLWVFGFSEQLAALSLAQDLNKYFRKLCEREREREREREIERDRERERENQNRARVCEGTQ